MIVMDTVSTVIGIQQKHFTEESSILFLNFTIQTDEYFLLFHFITKNYSNWEWVLHSN